MIYLLVVGLEEEEEAWLSLDYDFHCLLIKHVLLSYKITREYEQKRKHDNIFKKDFKIPLILLCYSSWSLFQEQKFSSGWNHCKETRRKKKKKQTLEELGVRRKSSGLLG